MNVVQLTTPMEKDYQGFLSQLDESLLYYSVKYKDFLAELLRCQPNYWLAMEDGDVQGVLPLMVKEGPYGVIWNSLPFYGSNGGVLAKTDEAAVSLYKHYQGLLQEHEVAASTLISNPLKPLEADAIPHDVVDDRIGQFISFLEHNPMDCEAFLAAIDSSARRNIKKAISSGITVEVDNTALVFLEQCHYENMAAMGGKAKSPDFFRIFPKHFTAGEDYKIYVAKQDGQLISALLLFYFNKTVEYFIPVTLASFRNAQPMALILFQAMQDAAKDGFTRWNWGGTWLTQDGVYRFKKKWNAIDLPYRYYTKINQPSLLKLSREELLQAYDNFFVVPFSLLN